jgi:hypothetical protein
MVDTYKAVLVRFMMRFSAEKSFMMELGVFWGATIFEN